MKDSTFDDPTMMVPLRLEERNRIAQQVIDIYAVRHGAMDVGVGLIGLLPGAAIPALMTAIALQAPTIYQPMARKLSRVYMASPEELEYAQDNQVLDGIIANAGLDLVAEFGIEFLKEVAGEIVAELGFGAVLTFIPFFGAIAAGALDYAVATTMTRRVGKMCSIYFQNGAAWVGSKRETYELAKETTGDLNVVRQIGKVRRVMIKNIRAMVEMLRNALDIEQIRRILKEKGIPDDLLEEALA
jgi:uncharacterized protein (DUF697 family)